MMKKIFTNILVLTMIFTTVMGSFPVTAFAHDSEEESSYTNESSYCNPGEIISITEAARAYNDGKILFELSTSTNNTTATFKLLNKTNCKFPVSLSSYKMFDGVLSHQEFYAGTGLVYSEEYSEISVDLPSCMAQIDAWYGLHPTQLLDSNPYGYPNVPMVIAFKFLYNSGTGYHDPIGPLCKKEVPNTPPVITLIGSSTVSITAGDVYTDLGATATDLEDGNITANIVTTGVVNTNVVGAYTIAYNVTDSKGLKAVEVKRIVNVYPKIILPKTAIVSATKIVCNAESDLPNYGAGGPDITSTTATAYVEAHPTCKIVPWTFEWASNDVANPGDQVKTGGEKWTTFESSTIVPVGDRIWVREQFNENYIPFSGLNTTESVSAELYCDTDVLNYDNYDWFVPSVSGKTYYCVGWNVLKNKPENTPPVITLVGSNPVNVYQGDTYTDLGATATDLEDGNITANIVTAGVVNTNILGTYTITYNVKDSQGLAAVEVKRTVNVLEKDVPPTNKGKITFCLVITDEQNIIATSSSMLPTGSFSINLATSTNFASTTVKSKTWGSTTFAPNAKIVSNTNDSDCVTFDNLDLGTYNYSELSINGSRWNVAKYNDQSTQPVNNIFDLFLFGSAAGGMNSDGIVSITNDRKERTVVLLTSYKPAPQCLLPEITSPLTANVTVGNAFTYTITASTTDTVLSVATSTLPSWLTYATTTNTLSGTPTAVGTYTVAMSGTNTCGVDNKNLVITVVNGGGGGGGGPTSDLEVVKTADKTVVNPGDTVTYTLVLTNKGPNDATNVGLSDVLPGTLALVSATSTSGVFATTTGFWTIGNLVNNASTTLTIVANVKSDTFGQKIVNTATASSTVSDPNSGNNTGTFEINVNPAPTGGCTNCGGGGGGGGGGNGPISTFVPVNGTATTTIPAQNSCYYLYDYLRKDFNNNPVEVKKLQVFLRDLEGFKTVQVTGVYDDQTITALNAFQDRYKADILTPWGHNAPTSYTYITTKKKVNEIYCKMAFPVTAQQQIEIDTYRNFLLGLRNAGVVLPTEDITPAKPINSGTPTNPIILDGQVGVNTDVNENDNGSLGTLAGYSSSTQKFVNSLTANVISSGKKFLNTLLGVFSWPFGKDAGVQDNQCVNDGFGGIGWLNYILILIIIIISYLWYREYRNNRKIEEINKEINLQ
jgi:uncharacterized repeat protein (TIGR01451 family)